MKGFYSVGCVSMLGWIALVPYGAMRIGILPLIIVAGGTELGEEYMVRQIVWSYERPVWIFV